MTTSVQKFQHPHAQQRGHEIQINREQTFTGNSPSWDVHRCQQVVALRIDLCVAWRPDTSRRSWKADPARPWPCRDLCFPSVDAQHMATCYSKRSFTTRHALVQSMWTDCVFFVLFFLCKSERLPGCKWSSGCLCQTVSCRRNDVSVGGTYTQWVRGKTLLTQQMIQKKNANVQKVHPVQVDGLSVLVSPCSPFQEMDVLQLLLFKNHWLMPCHKLPATYHIRYEFHCSSCIELHQTSSDASVSPDGGVPLMGNHIGS